MAGDDASCTKLNNPKRRVQNRGACAHQRRGRQRAGWRPDVQLRTGPTAHDGVPWSGDDLVKPTDPEQEPPPTVCPFCRSVNISVPTEKVSASTYWRCDGC